MVSLKFGPLVTCGALLLFVGCSDGGVGSGDEQDVYPVTGKITMNGAPVPGATVTFSPKGKQPVAYGRTNSSGEYALTTYEANDGAAEGDYEVMVSKTVAAKGNAADDEGLHQAMTSGGGAPPGGHGGAASGEDEGSGSLLPEKYGQSGSGLAATVTTDESKNKFDFDLKP